MCEIFIRASEQSYAPETRSLRLHGVAAACGWSSCSGGCWRKSPAAMECGSRSSSNASTTS